METVGVLIETVLGGFRNLWYSKKEVVGYILSRDVQNGRTYLLVKEGERAWKTSWYNDEEYTYKTPDNKLSDIFNHTP